MSQTKQGVIEKDGFSFHYRIEGKGPSVLVLGSSIYYPRSFSESLRNSLTLHFVDYRGFATPPSSEVQQPLSWDLLIDDIEHLRQTLALDTCIVIGHSAHGLLALEYAKKYPQHVTHVCMIGISPNLGTIYASMAERNWEEAVWPQRKAAFAKRCLEFSDEKLAHLPPSEKFVKWNVRRAPLSWFDYTFDSSVLWAGTQPNMSVLDFFYRVALRDLDVTKGLESFERPVLLCFGRFDYIIAPVCCWDPIRPKFKHLTVRVFEHSGHSPHYEEPALFNEILLDFLKI